MINSRKKGFTLVELVIVIAVVAILAAVLIPTFSSLVRKAKESADLQLAKNLNTALTIAEASGEKISEFSDVLEVLYEEGYVIANLNPTAEDNWYAWDESTNQILYLNSKFEIIYQSKDSGNKENWIIGVGTAEDRITVQAAQIRAYFTPNNTDDLNAYIDEVLSQIANGQVSGEQKIIFGGNVDFDNDPLYNINNSNADLTFDLGGSTLGGTVVQEVAPLFVAKGNVTLKNGTFTAEGKHISDDGSGKILSSSVQLGDKGLTDAQNSKLIVDNMIFDTQATAVRVYYGSAEVKNTTMNVVGGQSVYVGTGASVVLANVTANVKNYHNIFVSSYGSEGNKEANLKIESGTYNLYDDGNNYNITVYHGAKIEILNGTFGAYNNSKVKTNHMFNVQGGTITISGGTFNGKSFSALTEAEWKGLCNTTSVSVTGVGTSTVVISKN